jgi:hypothetical protein
MWSTGTFYQIRAVETKAEKAPAEAAVRIARRHANFLSWFHFVAGDHPACHVVADVAME